MIAINGVLFELIFVSNSELTTLCRVHQRYSLVSAYPLNASASVIVEQLVCQNPGP